MNEVLTTLDLVVFIVSLMVIMGIGLWAGRREETSTDYYLAGKTTRWWGVAASIFGSNVSANHIIGMMGVGFSVGFAQSHFEISAIAGLMLLCFGFLPVYRKLNVFTLSEYLSRRYDERNRFVYAVIMLVVIVVIQMVPGFYIGSRSLNLLRQGGPGDIPMSWYVGGILLMAFVTGTYTILGGLKAVIITDVIQSILMLLAGLLVAVITFSQSEIGGWAGMVALDAGPGGAEKLHLYNASNHPELPWTGVLTGLMVLHFYYWGTNQFIVQRALSGRSDQEARLGILAAGFLKLLIPFFSIATGIAAYYLFAQRGQDVAQDAVFTTLLTELVAPLGFGLVGVVAAGMIGAILSSVDSMLNSAATIITFDVYQRYARPEAGDRELIWVGRAAILVFIVGAAALTILTMDPNSQDSFFLQIATHQSKLIAGVVVAFGLGMLWKGATPAGSLAAIIAGVVFSYGLPVLYDQVVDAREVTEFEASEWSLDKARDWEAGDAVGIRSYGPAPELVDGRTVDLDEDYYVWPSDRQRVVKLFETKSEAETGEGDALTFAADPAAPLFLYPAGRRPIVDALNVRLNFMHSVFAAAVLALLVHVVISRATRVTSAQQALTWTGLQIFSSQTVRRFFTALLATIAVCGILAVAMVREAVSPMAAAFLGAGWTSAMFVLTAVRGRREGRPVTDLLLAGLLAGLAVFMMYYFY